MINNVHVLRQYTRFMADHTPCAAVTQHSNQKKYYIYLTKKKKNEHIMCENGRRMHRIVACIVACLLINN